MKLEIIGYKKYKLLEDISYGTITVPAGFEFDVTVPKVIWFIVGGLMFSKVVRAVATHDYNYTNKQVDRSVADAYLRDMLLEDGTNVVSAWIAYIGARAIGWYFWKKG